MFVFELIVRVGFIDNPNSTEIKAEHSQAFCLLPFPLGGLREAKDILR